MLELFLTKGGTALLGLLALAGDFGCVAGPAMAGAVAARFENQLQVGFLFSTVFAVLMAVSLGLLKRVNKSI